MLASFVLIAVLTGRSSADPPIAFHVPAVSVEPETWVIAPERASVPASTSMVPEFESVAAPMVDVPVPEIFLIVPALSIAANPMLV